MRAPRRPRSICCRSIPGARRAGPQAAADDHREVRRRPGGHRQPGGGDGRGARHARGCDRAVPDPAGLHRAHRARARGDAPGLAALRPARCPSAPPPICRCSARTLEPLHLAGAGLLGGHRCRRHRLLCELSALPRARAQRVVARPRGLAARAGAPIPEWCSRSWRSRCSTGGRRGSMMCCSISCEPSAEGGASFAFRAAHLARAVR